MTAREARAWQEAYTKTRRALRRALDHHTTATGAPRRLTTIDEPPARDPTGFFPKGGPHTRTTTPRSVTA